MSADHPADGRRRSRPGLRRRRKPAELITDARRSPVENQRQRRRTYLLLQFARVPLFALAGVALVFFDNVWLAVLFSGISLPLPWIAVLLANEKGEKTVGPKVYKPAVVRENRAAYQQELASRRTALESGPGTTALPATPEAVIIDHDEDD